MFNKEKSETEPMRLKRPRQKVLIALLCVVVLTSLGLAWYFKPWTGNEEETAPVETQFTRLTDTEGIQANGSTALGALTQFFQIDPTDLDLKVDSVAVKSGDLVDVGSPVLTLTANSLANARQELTDDVDKARNAFNQSAIDYQSALVEIRATWSANKSLAKIAEDNYNIALFDLNNAVDSAREAMDDAHGVIANHPALIEALEKELDFSEEDLEDAEDEFDESQGSMRSSQSEVEIVQADLADAEAVLDFLEENRSEFSQSDEYDILLEKATELRDEAKDKIEPAVAEAGDKVAANQVAKAAVSNFQSKCSELESMIASLESELEKAKSSLADVELVYHQANLKLIQKTIDEQLSYQSSLVDYRNARILYDLDVLNAESDYKAAETALEEAQKTLADFEAELGTGVLLSRYSGAVSSVGYESADELDLDTAPVILVDSAAVTVTISVDQTQISQLAVGDPASVTISAMGRNSYEGKISSIIPESSSPSLSEVFYTVVVKLEGDVNGLSSDLDAVVTLEPRLTGSA